MCTHEDCFFHDLQFSEVDIDITTCHVQYITYTIGFGMKSNLYNGFYYCNLRVLEYLATKVA